MFSKIPLYQSIQDYNQAISIPLPRHTHFDVRDFNENMKTVRLEMPTFRHGFYQVALLESGGGKVSSDGEEFDLENFSLFFTQPGQIIQWQVPQDWRGYYVSVAEPFYTMALDQFKTLTAFPFFQRFVPAFQLKKSEAELLLKTFQAANAEYQRPAKHSEVLLKSYLATILSLCIRHYDREVEEVTAKSAQMSLEDRFKRSLREYSQAVGAGLVTDHKSVSDFAAELAVSASHLSEAVKKATGQSPIDHINQVLVEEAQKLLRTTDMAIKEVGYYLGFNSPSYFNRLFKKLAGTSPAAYRKA